MGQPDNARTKKKRDRSSAGAASDNSRSPPSTKRFRSHPATLQYLYSRPETKARPASATDPRRESPSPTADTAPHNLPATCTARLPLRPSRHKKSDSHAFSD